MEQFLIRRASLVTQRLKRLPPMWDTWVRSLGREDPLEKEIVTYSSILAWRIPRMEEPGGLQSTGSQRVRQDWATSLSLSQVSQRQILWLKRWMFNINRLRFESCLIIYPGKVSQSPLSSVSLSLKCWEIIHTSHGGCNNRAGHVRAWTVPSIPKKKKKKFKTWYLLLPS